ncbi:MAG: hypothetical protein NTW21_44860, partial [Verrucomicrobia bacterium]|nr:hypothetical protein [Verrucomicrobiota bacterium]
MKTTTPDSNRSRLWPHRLAAKSAVLSLLLLGSGLFVNTASAAIVPVDKATAASSYDFSGVTGTHTTTDSITVTTPASHSTLVVMVGWRANGGTTLTDNWTFTYNDLPLTKAVNFGSPGGTQVGSSIYYLHNPPAGTANLVGTITSDDLLRCQAVISWMTLGGVDTTAAVVTGGANAAGLGTPFTAVASGIVIPKADCFAVENLCLRGVPDETPQTFTYSANSGARTGTQVTYGVIPGGNPFVHSGAGYVSGLTAGTYDLSVTAPSSNDGRYGMAAVVFSPTPTAVAVVDKATAASSYDFSGVTGTHTTTDSITVTTPASDSTLVVMVGWRANGGTTLTDNWTFTYNDLPLTKAVNFGSPGGTQVGSSIYYLHNPPAGTANLVGTITSDDLLRCQLVISWMTLSDVDTTAAVVTGGANVAGLGTPFTAAASGIVIPSAGCLAVENLCLRGVPDETPQTFIYSANAGVRTGTQVTYGVIPGGNPFVHSGAGYVEALAAGTYDLSVTAPSSNDGRYGMAAVVFAPAFVANTYTISGTISCSDAADAAGAHVQLKQGATVFDSVTVPSGGAYSFTVLPGTWTIAASKNTYTPVESSPIAVSDASITQDLTLTKLLLCTVSGTVHDGVTGIGGVVVTASYAGGSVSTPSSVVDGTYSLEVPTTLLVTMSASSIPVTHLLGSVPAPFSAPDATPIGGKDVVLVTNPEYDADLVFSAKSSAIAIAGGTWPCAFPGTSSFGKISFAPGLTTVNSQQMVTFRYGTEQGYRANFGSQTIPCAGATVVAVVQPVRSATTGDWSAILNCYYNSLNVTVHNVTGRVQVMINNVWHTGPEIPDGQLSVVSAVIGADSSIMVYVNGVGTTIAGAGSPYTQITDGGTGNFSYGHNFDIGRNDPDAWSVWNGNVGDVYLYKTAISATKRNELEGALGTKFGIEIAPPPAPATISGTVVDGGEGVIVTTSPEGLTGTTAFNGTYTITGATSGTTYTLTASNLPIGKLVDTAPAAFLAVPGENAGQDFTLKDAATIRGTVTDGGTGVQNVVVTANPGALTGTTLAGGTYEITGASPGVEYTLTASSLPVGKMVATSPAAFIAVAGANDGNDFTLAADPANDTDLIFALRSSDLGTGNWACAYPVGSSLARGGSPTTTTINGQQWETNHMTSGDRYNASSLCPAPYAMNGGSIVVAVRPIRPTSDDHTWDWDSIVDMQYDQMVIGIRNWDGRVCVRRKGSLDVSGASIPS